MKKVEKTGKILDYIFILGISILLAVVGPFLYYSYAPLSLFIDYQKLDVVDFEHGAESQTMLSYRVSRIATLGNFRYKFHCNEQTQSDWTYTSDDVVLNKTNGIQVVTVNNNYPFVLPKGECILHATIKIDVKGYEREKELTDRFIVK